MDTGCFEFDARKTGGTRFLDQNNDTVAWLHADVFPPVGTKVLLPGEKEGVVTDLTLDLNSSHLAQVMVGLRVEPDAQGE